MIYFISLLQYKEALTCNKFTLIMESGELLSIYGGTSICQMKKRAP